MNKNQFRFHLLVTSIVAFASMIYEFIFAHILSILRGGTILNYTLTIAIFTFCLGLGSLSYDSLKLRFSKNKVFINTEFLLSIVGITAPLLILITPVDLIFFGFRTDIFITYLGIIAVGFLSGIELPYLLDVNKNVGVVLSADYLGMFIASSVFAWYLLPTFGILGLSVIVGLLNLICACFFLKNKSIKIVCVGTVFVLFIVTIILIPELNLIGMKLFAGKYNV